MLVFHAKESQHVVVDIVQPFNNPPEAEGEQHAPYSLETGVTEAGVIWLAWDEVPNGRRPMVSFWIFHDLNYKINLCSQDVCDPVPLIAVIDGLCNSGAEEMEPGRIGDVIGGIGTLLDEFTEFWSVVETSTSFLKVYSSLSFTAGPDPAGHA